MEKTSGQTGPQTYSVWLRLDRRMRWERNLLDHRCEPPNTNRDLHDSKRSQIHLVRRWHRFHRGRWTCTKQCTSRTDPVIQNEIDFEKNFHSKLINSIKIPWKMGECLGEKVENWGSGWNWIGRADWAVVAVAVRAYFEWDCWLAWEILYRSSHYPIHHPAPGFPVGRTMSLEFEINSLNCRNLISKRKQNNKILTYGYCWWLYCVDWCLHRPRHCFHLFPSSYHLLHHHLDRQHCRYWCPSHWECLNLLATFSWPSVSFRRGAACMARNTNEEWNLHADLRQWHKPSHSPGTARLQPWQITTKFKNSFSKLICSLINFKKTYVSLFHFQFVVNAGSEIVQDDHFAIGWQAVLFFDPNTDECFDGSAASDASHSWRSDRVFIISCQMRGWEKENCVHTWNHPLCCWVYDTIYSNRLFTK